VALPAVLLISLALMVIVRGTFEVSLLEARAAGVHRDRIEARNAAGVLLDQLVARVMERWPGGSGACAFDTYCAQDFPRVERLRERFADKGVVTLTLGPPAHLTVPRSSEERVSSASASRYRLLEARVRIDGPSPVFIAEGIVLPEPAL
jgi:hypothetical protein